MQHCAQEHLSDCWLMTGAGLMVVPSSGPIIARTGPPSPLGSQKSCQASGREGSAIPWRQARHFGSRAEQSQWHLHRAPALGNTWPGGDARDRGVGASSFGRGKSGGTQTSDYLRPELLSGGSL